MPTELTLSQEQSDLVTSRGGRVVVRDPQGRMLGTLQPDNSDEEPLLEVTLEELKKIWERAYADPREFITTEQFKARFLERIGR